MVTLICDVFLTDDQIHALNNGSRICALGDWKPWFAWRPVRVRGRWVFFEKIFRRRRNYFISRPSWEGIAQNNILEHDFQFDYLMDLFELMTFNER